MSRSLIHSVLCCAALLAAPCLSTRVLAQDSTPLYEGPPTYPGFQLPRLAGTLRYSLTGSEVLQFGDNISNSRLTSFSGDLGYLSHSTTSPFSLIYSGGVAISDSTSNSYHSVFQSLSASQVLNRKRWQFLFADSISYLPNAPVSGLAGVPGLGDVGVSPVQAPGLIDLQSQNSTRISNDFSASASRSLTGRTSLVASGTYGVLRFPGGQAGVENNSESVTAGLSHAFSARTQLTSTYFYSRTSFLGYNFSSVSQGATFDLSHKFSPRLTGDVSAGPVFTKSTGVDTVSNANYSAGLTYVRGFNSYSLRADRRINQGSGVIFTNRSTDFAGTFSRRLSQFSSFAASGFYTRNNALANPVSPAYSFSSESGSVQFNQSLSRVLSVYASYTYQHQDLPATAFALNPLTGNQSIVGFGITYTPRTITVGRR